MLGGKSPAQSGCQDIQREGGVCQLTLPVALDFLSLYTSTGNAA